jgi:4'-phosphopantetheinyl transferase
MEEVARVADVTGMRANDADVTVAWASTDGQAAALLRAEVSQFVGVPPHSVRLSRSCPQCGSADHGRPVVLGEEAPFVSLSRAGGVVMVAVSGHGPVGVDVERLDAPRFAGFDDVALHDHEIAPTVEARATTWVRKESLLKATGDALHVDLRQVRLSDPDLPPELVEWSAPNPPATSVWMQDLEVEGHAACVTVLSQAAPRVTARQAAPEEPPG